MKKILFVINTMGRAGAETALIELLKKLTRMGEYDISLYAIIPRGELFARVPDGVRIRNRGAKAESVLSASGRAAILRKAVRAFCYRGTGIRMIPYLVKNVAAQKKSGRVQIDKAMWRMLAEGSPAQREEYDLAVAYIEGASAYYLADKVRTRRKAAFIHIDYQKAGYTPKMDLGCYDHVDRIFVVSNEVGEKVCLCRVSPVPGQGDAVPEHPGYRARSAKRRRRARAFRTAIPESGSLRSGGSRARRGTKSRSRRSRAFGWTDTRCVGTCWAKGRSGRTSSGGSNSMA